MMCLNESLSYLSVFFSEVKTTNFTEKLTIMCGFEMSFRFLNDTAISFSHQVSSEP